MPPTVVCSNCRGKFELLAEGAQECEVCENLRRLRNLVLGSRFPGELRTTASRSLHSCYLQLLQEADTFYYQQPTVVRKVDENQSKDPLPNRRSPRATDKREGKYKNTEKKDRSRKGDKDRSPDKKEKHRKRRSVKEEEEEKKTSPPEKERKRHRREEDERAEASPRKVKEESPEAGKEAIAHVKEEEELEEEEQESESPTRDEPSPSKSPLPRRRPLSPSARPNSPVGPPPPREGDRDRGGYRAPAQPWVGPIPAGGSRRLPKARAKAEGRRRGVRRPAAVEEDPLRQFDTFEAVKASDLPAATLLSAGRLWCTEVSYWKELTQCVGVFKSLRVEGEDLWMEMKVEGTTSEHLLKHLTGVSGGRIRAHLCGAGCAQELTADDIIHVVKVKRLRQEEEEDWMKNLLAAGKEVDELEALRTEARLKGGESPLEGGEDEAKKKKEKKEKKKAKEKRKVEEKTRSPSQGGPRRRGARDLRVILGGSGLDPDPKKRKKYLQRAKRLVKKKKKKKSSGSTSSGTEKKSSSEDSSSSPMGAQDIFGQTKMARRIAERCPGVLTASSLAAVQEQLLNTQGLLWELDRRELPPLFLQYFRSHLCGRMSPAMRREALHLSVCLDLGLQGLIPQLMDTLGQRLKALEAQASGKHWSVTTQFEVVPDEQGSVATMQETEAAMKEAREAGKIRGQAGRPYGAPRGRQGQRKGKREVTARAAENESKTTDKVDGADESPGGVGERSIEDALAPGLGVSEWHDSRAVVAEEQQKKPSFTLHAAQAEGTASGPTQEHTPVSATCGTTNLFDREVGDLEGKKLVAMGPILNHALDGFDFISDRHSKPQPMGKGKDEIFPLPLSSPVIDGSSFPDMVRATCRALNSLYGMPKELKKEPRSAACVRALKFVCGCVEAMVKWDVVFPRINFDVFFRSKGVDYRGEEVKVAQQFSWETISPALPPEVGGVSLVDFCTLGTRYYIEHFPEFLVPPEKQHLGRSPTVMVGKDDWLEVCRGLTNCGVCGIIPLEQVYHIRGKPLLGGLFGVGKGEYQGGREVQRLIMNYVPLNENCRSLDSDIATLPGISGLSPFMLEGGEVALISSEDIRCFFYLFKLPETWYPFLGFNRDVPPELVPPVWKGKRCVLHARVLPMGFKNSVGIAQHVHRNVIRDALGRSGLPVGAEQEMRKDRPATSSKEAYRVYLDNFDIIQKVDPETADQVEGQPSMLALLARQAYADAGLPRHPKKSTCQSKLAEVQGAILDGSLGVAYPKPAKVGVYVSLALELLRRGAATQRELQVVCGGFVYFSLFRRPLLSALNAVWKLIEELKGEPPVVRVTLPVAVSLELARFCALIPLARLDFRLTCMGQVTASDASSTGGGACVSTGLTAFGAAAANASVRGDIPEEHDLIQVLSIGMFDGVGCLRMACDLLGLPMAGHISIEKSAEGRRVVESAFADTIFVEDVCLIDATMVQEWAGRFSQVGLVLLGAGPPCQGVSGLNADKRGALKDHRSCLFQHVPRVRELLQQAFPWAQVRTLMESVASMDNADRAVMSEAIGEVPFRIDAAGVALARRPRLYWCDWELHEMDGVRICLAPGTAWDEYHEVYLSAEVDPSDYLEPGWRLQGSDQRLPTFTTSRPSPVPGRRPAGLEQCTAPERERWSQDLHRFPPYQYRDHNCITNKKGDLRVASLLEREVIMGMPAGYTKACWPKNERSRAGYEDARLSLVGNWLVGSLAFRLGLCPSFTPQSLVQVSKPGGSSELQRLLLRPRVKRSMSVPLTPGVGLVKKLAGLVSLKGEDLLLQSSSEQQVKYQRLRASLPARLWRWKTIAGWQWTGSPEHINVLELRAIYTTIRWWISQGKAASCRLVHLTDSLVCLHALSRGRSSSRKMRRTLAKINSLLLVCNLHPIWAFVSTADNPADRPSLSWAYRSHGIKGVGAISTQVLAIVFVQLSTKLVLQHGFPYPTCIALVHFSLVWLVSYFMETPKKDWKRYLVDKEELLKDAAWYGRRILPIAVLQTANVVMNTTSLKYIGAGFNSIIGILCPVLTALVSAALGQSFTAFAWLGVVIAIAGDAVISCEGLRNLSLEGQSSSLALLGMSLGIGASVMELNGTGWNVREMFDGNFGFPPELAWSGLLFLG
eukprot:s2109_g2.t1